MMRQMISPKVLFLCVTVLCLTGQTAPPMGVPEQPTQAPIVVLPQPQLPPPALPPLALEDAIKVIVIEDLRKSDQPPQPTQK